MLAWKVVLEDERTRIEVYQAHCEGTVEQCEIECERVDTKLAACNQWLEDHPEEP
jgi:hypothetical protein